MATSHEALVVAQFGPRARAYVESADHSKGADLERLAEIVRATPGRRVLDLGSGGGHVSFAVAPYAAEVVAYDLSTEMLAAVRDVAKSRALTSIRTEHGRAESLPFDDSSFDFVFTRYSAHHWQNLAAGLAEMRRVLRPDGLAVVVDAVAPPAAAHDTFLQTIELLRDPSHVRDYSMFEWEAALRRAGLRTRTAIPSRLRLDFAGWVARIGTTDLDIRAIRALQARMPADVVEHFAIEADGSFHLDTMLIEAEV